MANTFTKDYRDALSNFDHNATNLSQSLGVKKARMAELQDKIYDFLENRVEKEKDVPRSSIYQELLYEIEPTCIMDMFLFGHILRGWEEAHTDIHDEKLVRGKTLMQVAIGMSREKVENREYTPELFLEFLDITEDYVNAQ